MARNNFVFPQSETTYDEGTPGLTLRDYFAAAALPIAWAIERVEDPHRTEIESELIAESAYELADAMLAVREK